MVIQDTRIPFAVVTTDRDTGERVVLREGNLRKAIRASMSIPLIFEPVEYNGKTLIDGGVSETVPVQTAKEMEGAERVIAVNSSMPRLRKMKEKPTVGEIARNLMDLFCKTIAERDCQAADVVIKMPIEYTPLSAFGEDSKPYIELGQKTTREVMDKIKAL